MYKLGRHTRLSRVKIRAERLSTDKIRRGFARVAVDRLYLALERDDERTHWRGKRYCEYIISNLRIPIATIFTCMHICKFEDRHTWCPLVLRVQQREIRTDSMHASSSRQFLRRVSCTVAGSGGRLPLCVCKSDLPRSTRIAGLPCVRSSNVRLAGHLEEKGKNR